MLFSGWIPKEGMIESLKSC